MKHSNIPVIAIDGPAASGKGTIAGRVAKALGFHYLDSGALYRLATLAALKAGISLDDAQALEFTASRLAPVFEAGRILLDGEDVTQAIRSEAVSAATSKVAAVPGVRRALFELQRRAVPEAPLKVFMTASAHVRAERRYRQLLERGEKADLNMLTADLEARDRRDRERASAPLKPADDARLLDTSAMGIEEVVGKVLEWWDECR